MSVFGHVHVCVCAEACRLEQAWRANAPTTVVRRHLHPCALMHVAHLCAQMYKLSCGALRVCAAVSRRASLLPCLGALYSCMHALVILRRRVHVCVMS